MRSIHWIAAIVIAAMSTLHAQPLGRLGAVPSRVEGQQQGRYDVSRYGAVGDGKTIETEAINKAIDAAAAAGGGTVVFHAGRYLSGSIHLKSHVALFLDHGAVIEAGPIDKTPYDTPEPNPWDKFQDFGHSHWHNSLIWGEDLDDVAIYGTGMIHGTTLNRSANANSPAGTGNKAIALKNSRNIFIRRGNRARTPGEPPPGVMRHIIVSHVVASGVHDQQGVLISGIPNYPIEDQRLSNIRIHYTGGGTAADAARDPDEKENDYPEPDMFGRLPVYALFARHVAGLDVRDVDFSFEKSEARPAVQLRDVIRVDMDNVRVQGPGTTARELLKPIHIAKAVKETF